jgi:hypothetical protein
VDCRSIQPERYKEADSAEREQQKPDANGLPSVVPSLLKGGNGPLNGFHLTRLSLRRRWWVSVYRSVPMIHGWTELPRKEPEMGGRPPTLSIDKLG